MYIVSSFNDFHKNSTPARKFMNLYQHSGKIGNSPLLLLFVAVPLLIILSCIYGYITVYNPIAGYLTFLIMIGYVFLCGLVVSMLLKAGKCRSKTFCLLGGIAAGLFSLYFAWLFFLYALLHRFDFMEIGFLDILLSPSAMLTTILEINKTGWFTIKSATPSGILLWIFWGIEALTVVLGVTIIGSSAIDDEMFCEKCGVWCDISETKNLKLPENLADQKANDINPLTIKNLEDSDGSAKPLIQAELLKCSHCTTYKGWRYKKISSEIDKNGDEKDKSEIIPGIVLTA